MRPKRLTPLAARAIEFRDKVEASTEHVQALKKQLEAGGVDYADAANQCEAIEREFDRLSDLFVDLSVLILKADKVKEYQPLPEAPSPMSDAANREGGEQSRK